MSDIIRNDLKTKYNQQKIKQQETHTETKDNPVKERISIFNAPHSFRKGLSRSRLSEVVSNTRNVYAELLQDPTLIQNGLEFKVGIVNKTEMSLPYSCLFHYLTYEGRHYYFTFILAGSGEVQEEVIKRENGMEFVEYNSPADIYSAPFKAKVLTCVKAAVNDSTGSIHDCGFMVIPKELKLWEDDEALKECAFFASASIDNMINKLAGRPGFNIAHDTSDRDYFKARIEYNPDPETNALRMPVRSDIRITVSAQSNNDGMDNTMPLSSIDCFVDLVLDANAAAGGNMSPGGFMQPVQQSTQVYIPRIVIPRIDILTDFISPETMLLGVLNAGLLVRQNAYLGAWVPRKNVPADEDFRDLGAVNFELNMQNEANPSRAPLKDDQYTQQHFSIFANQVIQNRPVFTILIEDGGELTWIQKMFLDAANRVVGAEQELYNAAYTLTNGAFAETAFAQDFRAKKAHICSIDDAVGNMHSGYYIDKYGEKRDIKEIDYLAMLNIFGATDMNQVNMFADTFDQIGIDIRSRMSTRKELYDNAVGKVHFYGKSTMVNIDPLFLNSLIEAANSAGLQIDPNADKHFNLQTRGRTNMGQYGVQFTEGANNTFTNSNINNMHRHNFGGRNW